MIYFKQDVDGVIFGTEDDYDYSINNEKGDDFDFGENTYVLTDFDKTHAFLNGYPILWKYVVEPPTYFAGTYRGSFYNLKILSYNSLHVKLHGLTLTWKEFDECNMIGRTVYFKKIDYPVEILGGYEEGYVTIEGKIPYWVLMDIPTFPVQGTALNIQDSTPSHYDMAINPVEFIIKNKIPFVEGNIIKYVCRYKRKNGLEDLKKAAHYLQMLIDNYDN